MLSYDKKQPESIKKIEVSRQSDARNKVIAPVFKRMGIIDQWGNGLKLIVDEFLFGKNSPVQLADFNDVDCDSVPLFRQVKRLQEMIEKEENLKLTQTGNLPPRIVKEVYSEGAS